MRNIIITTIGLLLLVNTANASVQYDLIEKPCTKTDIVIGVAGGVVAATAVAITAVSASPVIGGVAGVKTVGLASSFSAPFLTGSTLPAIATSNAIFAPIYSIGGYYASCLWRNIIGN